MDLGQKVREFISEQINVPFERIRPGMRLLQDFGVDGDDATELFEAFEQRFAVDLSGFVFERHFGPEGGPPIGLLLDILRRLWGKYEPLVPVTVDDLIASAESGKWTMWRNEQ